MVSPADITAALGQAAAGQKVDSNSISTDMGIGETSPDQLDDPNRTAYASDSTVDGESSPEANEDGSNNPTDSSKSPESTDSSVEANSKADGKTPGTKEVITVSDDKGRRKVEVDFSNREQLKKFVQMAYGARKWQAERDQAIQSKSKVADELRVSKENWTLLDNVYKKSGVEGLVDLLEGRQGAHRDYEKRVLEKQKFLDRASPEEIEAYNSKQELERIRRENAETRQENEKFKQEVVRERETAEMRAMESRVHPVFDKYRFADKLGDSHDEHMFDEMLWNSALKRLEPYEEQGLDITPELVEREFRSVASAIRKRIGIQAEKKATRTVDQKKQEATENVQAKVMSGYRSGGAAKEARDMLNSGNTLGLLKGFGKYKEFFGGKK